MFVSIESAIAKKINCDPVKNSDKNKNKDKNITVVTSFCLLLRSKKVNILFNAILCVSPPTFSEVFL